MRLFESSAVVVWCGQAVRVSWVERPVSQRSPQADSLQGSLRMGSVSGV